MGIRAIKPWLFMMPALIIYMIVIFLPTLYTFYLSFFNWNGVALHKDFTWFSNYTNLLLHDEVFTRSLKNNLIWSVGSLTLIVGIGLLLALLLNSRLKGRVIFRSIFFFPSVLSGVIVGTIWTWMYNPSYGIVNSILVFLGLESWTHSWLAEPKIALYAVFVAAIWQGVGQPMVLFLAGLQTLPQEPYEASIIDGAKTYQRFFYLTLPLLRETFVIVVAITVVGSMKVYDIIYSMTGGGPAESTHVLASYMYYQTFVFANIGIGSAVSMILVFIAMIVIIPYVLYTTRRSHL